MKPSVVTLGTFDGVHRGHQRIIRKVVNRSRDVNGRSVVLAFGMPPRLARKPLPSPVLLTTVDEKAQILKHLGIDQIAMLVFNRRTASTLPEDFFQRTICHRHHAIEMVVGPRVAFGKNRAGKLPLLKQLGRRHGVRIHVVPAVGRGRGTISSRAIRALLYRGDVDKAARELGYYYSLAGKVVHGNHRGRKLGYPTANIESSPLKIMPPGVFWVRVFAGNKLPTTPEAWNKGNDGLCNVGVRPTFSPQAKKLQCEVFLFQRGGGLYGKTLRIVFLKRIRAEKRFSSPQALKRQIDSDFQRAKIWSRSFSLQNRGVFL